ncbi:MAG: type IX secretion system sortase PorU, partial [Bacteroidia bacterium]|nr:type IX secretion system sortase PorU [Bacteroidia bacterium]
YGKDVCGDGTFTALGSDITITLKYNPSTSNSVGWLDYLELNVRQLLKRNGAQMHFRDMRSVGVGNVSDFILLNANAQTKIWEVSDPLTVVNQEFTLNGSQASFRIETDELREFVVFDGTSYFTPRYSSKIKNQNLHATEAVDMIILTAPVFKSEAERLAKFHRDFDDLRVAVVTTKEVYNEYSSGAQDVTAIRDFMKMLYDQATMPEDIPRYLLLFGDGSYDNKNRLTGNTNFIPSYQSTNSLALIASYVSDDYYGLLDDGEGIWNSGSVETLDVGIGRFPVKNIEEARNMVDKVMAYANPAMPVDPLLADEGDLTTFGDWRNVVCFIGDDEDGNLHLSQSNQLAVFVDTTYDCYNVDKIYFDAYPQVSTPGGQRYPGVNAAIDQRVDQGALLINYTGHGGEVGWGHEGVLDVPMINAWDNIKNLPVFMTATCEFSRWDDPGRTSAGELTFLNPGGGAIGLLTTVRLVYANTNFDLNKDMYRHVFEPINGKMPTLGDIFRLTKRDNAGVTNTRNFTLLGDPAVTLSYPKHNIKVTAVNGNTDLSQADTLSALSKITISGIVEDQQGNKLTNYNGIVYPSVLDKPVIVSTLNNDAQSPTTKFELQKNVLYKGKASVTNGDWSFTFIVPKDIAFQFDYGRLSFYAQNGFEDAQGCYDRLIIGGFSSSAPVDEEGPNIDLYMNDDKFVFGGTTDENPFIYALVSDSNGINTVGNGIGHDITAQLDEKSDDIFVLNDFYESDLNSYQTGKVRYPLQDLESGVHSIKLKVWDIYNNSSEAYTEFVVASSAKLALNHVLNYPNPFTTKTNFFFEHNKQGTALKAQIQIYTVSGKLIKTLDEYVINDGFRSDEISWDGRDEYGDRIGKGVYIYKLKVRTTDGEVAQKTEKLVILK